MKIIKSDLEKVERIAQAMAEEIANHGRRLAAIYRPETNGAPWVIWTHGGHGDLHQHMGKTLEDAYLAALYWPETPPPF